MNDEMTRRLLSEYSLKKKDIKNRLREFKGVWEHDDRTIFSELCFCICTPQSKAVVCDRAVSVLKENGKLFSGALPEIRAALKGVRFPNNKSRFIYEARDLFSEKGMIKIKDRIDHSDIPGTRDWLVKNVKGIGYKEASHFLRNVGFGKDLAILDVHILKNMMLLGVIKETPKSITRGKYLMIEGRIRDFSGKIKIPMDELDLLFWSNETGYVFK